MRRNGSPDPDQPALNHVNGRQSGQFMDASSPDDEAENSYSSETPRTNDLEQRKVCQQNLIDTSEQYLNPLDSNAALIAARLMQMSADVADWFNKELANGLRSARDFKTAQRMIDTQLKISKEYDKIAKLLLRNEKESPRRW